MICADYSTGGSVDTTRAFISSVSTTYSRTVSDDNCKSSYFEAAYSETYLCLLEDIAYRVMRAPVVAIPGSEESFTGPSVAFDPSNPLLPCAVS